jgi:glycosyltransferase involved in cell wall biosynthesis
MLLSVIIPTFRRPDSLAACLECIQRQSFPKEKFEVIVTDDAADRAIRDLIGQKYAWAKWTQGPGRGPAANRNHGASLATGEWLVFVDDDCLPAPSWLNAIGSQADVDVIEGKTVCPDARDTPLQERVENLRGGAYWSCNLAVRRPVFERMGGFDEDFLEAGGEDMEFAWRIAANKLHTRFVASALVEHPLRMITWSQLWSRTWLIRWIVLYRLKTGRSAPLRASWLRALWDTMKGEVANLLRNTLHYFSKFESKFWFSNLFHLCRKWIMFPLVLPYLMYWEIRFRRQLKNDSRALA